MAMSIEEGDRYTILAREWARYHGQRGTAKQIEKEKRQISERDLARMLSERGISIVETR